MNYLTPITIESFVPAISFETIKHGSRTLEASETFSDLNMSAFVTSTSKLPSTKPRAAKRKHHPSIPNMIDEAILERSLYGKGLSLVAIKKYLTDKYGVNMKYSAKRVRDYIKESVASGRFIQKTGYGANGSFSLSSNVRKYLNRKKRQSEFKTTPAQLGKRVEKSQNKTTRPSRSHTDKKQH